MRRAFVFFSRDVILSPTTSMHQKFCMEYWKVTIN